MRRCIHSDVIRDERRSVFTTHPTNHQYRQPRRSGPYAGAERTGRYAALVCGPSGLPVSRRVRRRAGAARSRGDSPVRREVIWPTILPYMFGLFESSQDVPGEAGRPSGREFQSPGVGSRPGGRHARPAEGGYWGVTPLENSSRSAGGSECMQEMAPRCGIIKGTDSPLIPSSFRRFEGVGRRRLTR